MREGSGGGGSVAELAGAPAAEMLRIERSECLLLEQALTREWLETDGRNGFAACTILMCPTRRYHGLLIAPAPGHDRRHLFLSRYDESIHGGEDSFPIALARYQGTWAPPGHQAIDSFALVPYPSFRYRIGSELLVREVLLVRGAPVALSRYCLRGPLAGLELRVRPLLPFRAADALTHENLDLDPRVERIPGGIRCRPYRVLPPIAITVGAREFRFEADPVWYRRLEYRADLARGYDGHEDQFSPGWFSIPLRPVEDIVIAASIVDPVGDPNSLWCQESARRRAAMDAVPRTLRGNLELAAEHFLYRTATGRRAVTAGFPWFGEYGRDTFIALPGLTLARGRVEECGAALEEAIPYLRDGLLPTVFGSTAERSHYGAADPALWFVRAVRLYERAGGSPKRIAQRLLPALQAIAEHYSRGTLLGIRADEAGLLRAGAPHLAVTWMDTCGPAGPNTPRDGCAVELNALWYFLLAYLEELHGAAGRSADAAAWRERRCLAGRGFLERFWLAEPQYLADRWHEGVADATVRPNMVIAAALEYSPLEKARREAIVLRAEVELLTPLGLRTLTPRDPRYLGRYMGGVVERDAAYHQGAVWPWLMGFYCEAWLRAFGYDRTRVEALKSYLEGFQEHLFHQGLNQISELAEGDPPHRPGGCFAQAWSVAEFLRSLALLEGAPL